jgi:hypothetical protein
MKAWWEFSICLMIIVLTYYVGELRKEDKKIRRELFEAQIKCTVHKYVE